MKITADEFPLYGELTKAHARGVAGLVADMAHAEKTGDVAAAYSVALGLYQLSDCAALRCAIPGITDDCVEATKAHCLSVFRQVAMTGHRGARAMVVIVAPKGLSPA